jgi:hypothetical protein
MSKKKTDKARLKQVTHTSGEEGQPVRIQISTSDGSEIASALEEIRSNIPVAFQKSFNLGAYFKEVLRTNDAEIAKLIRSTIKNQRLH